MPWYYYIAWVIVRVSLLLLTRWQVKGRENIPHKGPVLVIANHLHLADPLLVGMSLAPGRRAMFMAKKELFQPRFLFLGYLIRVFGSFPIHRGRFDRKALRQAERVLDDGLALAMFPEGMRSKNAQLQPAFSGPALIAWHSGVPILPIAITGSERIKGIAWLLRRPRLTVSIGPPFYLPPVNGKLSKAQLAELTNLMMLRIARLLPVEYRGNYAVQRD